MMLNNNQSSVRRFDIDWMRVILFGLLIPYHVAVGLIWGVYGDEFNGISSDITAYNDNIGSESFILLWMHTWRLPALFIISGIGTAYASKRRDMKQFRSERIERLVIPFMFGSFIVNLPIWWISSFATDPELANLDAVGTIIGAIVVTFFVWVFHIITIFELGYHLWFLKNLFFYSIVISLIIPSLQNPENKFSLFFNTLVKSWWGFSIVIPIPLVLIEVLIKPYAAGYTGHGYELYWYFIFFIIGYLLIGSKEDYFVTLSRYRVLITSLAILFSIFLFAIYLIYDEKAEAFFTGGWIWGGDMSYFNSLSLITSFIHSYHAWFWSMTLFSWAEKYLNVNSNLLKYLNQAVYPLYIWHMIYVLIGLNFMKGFDLSVSIKFLLITIFTVITSLLSVELVKSTSVSRRLFGIKEEQNIKIKLCEMCNSQVNDDDKFCTKCGNKFTMD